MCELDYTFFGKKVRRERSAKTIDENARSNEVSVRALDSNSNEEQQDTAEPSRAVRSKKRWLFRGFAILLGVAPFVVVELILVGIGWKPAGGVADPYVGFSEIRSLFEKDEEGLVYKIADSRLPLFQPDSFLVEKPDNEFRIFCVGGSTVQGRPFSIETSFSTWLELSLTAADSSAKWEVVNCGGVSYASYRLAPIIDEILGYQPDLIVLYTGHNEFLEDRTYQSIKTTSPWVTRTHERLSAIRTYSFLRSQFVGDGDSQPTDSLSKEVEARLDFKGGLDKYKRDDKWKQKVTTHFEYNLRRMAASAKKANVPLILMNPACNLSDASPFKSEHAYGLSAKEIQRFDTDRNSILENSSGANLQNQIQILVSLLEKHPRHADLHYQLGQTYQMAGELKKAKFHLVRAKEEDVCPLRATEPIYEAITQVRNEFDLPLIDVRAFFESLAEDGIPGRSSFLDHVHPTIYGHQQIAGLVLEEMNEQGIISVKTNPSKRDELFARHLESLDFMYFQRGKDRLAGLKRWAEGKVTKERALSDSK